ncbi:SCO family protein [Roseateles saccharophilus]|uniref:Protein SCO1/2 n=1 Tax=Roseateles saccharophilus TaxID=304 RepID=A0A4R3VA93_ROSSA|nr:SCO family protein [Roseateles saccharophilus]MDG0831644.1 SCO family protein [Roseateles saccharophilus]TCV00941.1 protein SCO1/2 [Roseateles saccharophilus]
MKRRHLLLSLAVVLPLAARAITPQLKAGVFEPAQPAPEFTLKGSDGAELKLARFKGKLVLLVFGFTNCPEVCPTTLATLAQARKDLGADAADVQVVYVTVDPERDDVTRIRKYLGAFDASFIGGTDTPDTLAAMRKRYGVVAEKIAPKQGNAYGMNHSTSVWLIDRTGKLRGMMPYGHEAKDFVHDLRLLLASK